MTVQPLFLHTPKSFSLQLLTAWKKFIASSGSCEATCSAACTFLCETGSWLFTCRCVCFNLILKLLLILPPQGSKSVLVLVQQTPPPHLSVLFDGDVKGRVLHSACSLHLWHRIPLTRVILPSWQQFGNTEILVKNGLYFLWDQVRHLQMGLDSIKRIHREWILSVFLLLQWQILHFSFSWELFFFYM